MSIGLLQWVATDINSSNPLLERAHIAQTEFTNQAYGAFIATHQSA